MQKKYQVFISSTFKDLVEERQDALRSVLDMGHIPSGMEVFPAVDLEQFEYIKKIIDECDYYVLIVGARYGSTDNAGVSFTEKEYRYAVEQKKTVLAFIHNDLANIPSGKTDTEVELQKKLESFRKEVSRSRMVQFWKTKEELKAKLIISLHKAMAEYPATGWMRANNAASEDLLAQINKLRTENDELRVKTALELNEADQRELADLDSGFPLRYKYKAWISNKWESKNAVATVSWRVLFTGLAPQFTKPQAAGIRESKLIDFLKENGFIPTSRESVSLFETDTNTIDAQLHAYGLLTSDVSSTVAGGQQRFVELTPVGRRKQLEWTIVRRSVEADGG